MRSELGQTRKSALIAAMSAFPPIATKLRTSREVRFVPSPEVARLDHLVGATEQRERDGEAERPGSLEVYH
jgi:hypothetical protein